MCMITSLRGREVALDVVHSSGTQEQCEKAIGEYTTKPRLMGKINELVKESQKDEGTGDFLEFAMSEDEDSDGGAARTDAVNAVGKR